MVVENVDGPRRARPGHVIVRPEAVGICGSDFHLFSGDLGALSGASDFYPRVQGHEVAAIVEDPGDGIQTKAGDRVAIWPLLPCGRCYPCRAGRPNGCPAFRLVGVHLDGGLQELLEVPEEQVFSVGDLDPGCACFVLPTATEIVLGSRTATAADFRYAISLVISARENISKLFSHLFPLARAAEAFEFAMSRPPDAVKIVVNVN